MTGPLIELQPLQGHEDTIKELQKLSSDLKVKALRSAVRAAAKPIEIAMKANASALDAPGTAGSRLEKAVNITQAKTGTQVAAGGKGMFVSLGKDEIGVIVGPNRKVEQVRKTGKRRGETVNDSVKGIAAIMEWGARAHTIRARRRFLWIGGRFAGRTVRHPGVRPRRWMGRAFEQGAPMMQERFYSTLEKWIQKNG